LVVRSRTIFAATLALLSLSVEAHAKSPKIAVVPFTAKLEPSLNALALQAQPAFSEQFVASDVVRLISLRKLNQALAKFKVKKKRSWRTKDLYALGRSVGADYTLSGDLSFAGDAYIMSVRLLDVIRKTEVWNEEVSVANRRKFRLTVRSLARQITERIKKRNFEQKRGL